MNTSHWSYDHIADIYASDMGRSMPFNDVAWYSALAQQIGGPVLELGCGTGRVLLAIARAGIPVTGIDKSLPMLARLRSDAQIQGVNPFIAQMDMCNLGFATKFRCIILAYSLITYVLDDAQAIALLCDLRKQLDSGGIVVIDTFIPKKIQHFSDFKPDYERNHLHGTLQRSKKITVLENRLHRIERRYVLRDHQRDIQRVIDTIDIIKPYVVEELHQIARRAGYAVDSCAFDYGPSESSHDAHFVTLSLRPV